jgi:hypothetical protein
MDTRNTGSKSGILVAGSVRGFWGWNNTFASQGGSATGCGTLESTNTAAILVNFTVVTPATGGYITAYPANVADVDKPLAATVNFTAGSVIGNNATVKLNQTGSGDDFKIYSTSNVHVVADIVGYYSKPVATALDCVTTASTTVAVAAGNTNIASAPACAASYTSTGLYCNTNSSDLLAYAFVGNTCAAKNTGAASQNLIVSQRCCRIPGR